MLFHCRMKVRLPQDMAADQANDIKTREKALCEKLQRDGKWPHLWRIAGCYANISIIDVADSDELHSLLSSLPLFPYMDIEVTPLAKHPSAI